MVRLVFDISYLVYYADTFRIFLRHFLVLTFPLVIRLTSAAVGSYIYWELQLHREHFQFWMTELINISIN